MTLHPTALVAVRQVARRADKALHAKISLALLDHQKAVKDMAAFGDRYMPRHGQRGAFARAYAASEHVQATWDFSHVPTKDDVAVLGGRHRLLELAWREGFERVGPADRAVLRECVRACQAAEVNPSVESQLAFLLDDFDFAEEGERELAALNASFADGTFDG